MAKPKPTSQQLEQARLLFRNMIQKAATTMLSRSVATTVCKKLDEEVLTGIHELIMAGDLDPVQKLAEQEFEKIDESLKGAPKKTEAAEAPATPPATDGETKIENDGVVTNTPADELASGQTEETEETGEATGDAATAESGETTETTGTETAETGEAAAAADPGTAEATGTETAEAAGTETADQAPTSDPAPESTAAESGTTPDSESGIVTDTTAPKRPPRKPQ